MTDDNRNTGEWNTGDWNTGDCNTGDCNTGNWNTGYSNTGDWNTGKWNTGYCNTGDWNTGNWNTGYCNTVTPDDCLIFNKPSKRSVWKNAEKPQWIYASLTKWIDDSDMTDKEKEAFPTYVTTGGYLKSYTSLKHAYVESWEKASGEDRQKTFNLPNFDAEVFEEIFGFNPTKAQKKKIVIDGKEVMLSLESFEELKKQLTGE